MLDRKLVQQLWDGIVTSYTSIETANREVLPLLDAHPELASVRFRDYEAGASGIDPGYAIHQAVSYGNLVLTGRLIDLGADVNVRGHCGTTPLAKCPLVDSQLAILELLLKAGADPNLADTEGITVLHASMKMPQAARIVPLLLRYGADPNRHSNDGRVPLHFWSKRAEAYLEVLHIMMAHGADIKAVDKMGETLLIEAIKIGSEAVAEMMRYGANVHTKTRRGWTALHAATDAHFYQQAPESIALLLQAGAVCSVKENRGYTPLHVAAANLDIGAAQLLLEAGADINARSYRRDTPLALVDAGKNPFDAEVEVGDMEEEEYESMAAFLREHGAIPTPGNVKRKKRPTEDEEW